MFSATGLTRLSRLKIKGTWNNINVKDCCPFFRCACIFIPRWAWRLRACKRLKGVSIVCYCKKKKTSEGQISFCCKSIMLRALRYLSTSGQRTRLPTWERTLMSVSWLHVKVTSAMSPVRVTPDAGNHRESSLLGDERTQNLRWLQLVSV